MPDNNERQPASISAVERDTGLSKDTLRVWERRYGFPRPARDAFGERRYSPDEVDKLRAIKRLIDQGHRPGRIIEMPLAELHQLARNGEAAKEAMVAADSAQAGSASVDLDQYLELLKAHRIDDLRTRFAQAVLRLGLAQFVSTIIAPMNGRVGEAWTRGYFEVFEEHLYTEAVQVVLRNAINAAPTAGHRPNVLLTTFPQESHSLGILMAEAMFTLEGCNCVSLGIQTPIREIVLAADAQHCDIVALSFSAGLGPNPVLEGIAELRARLPPATEIWAGGTCYALHRRPPTNVRTFKTLEAIAPAVAQWRAAHGAA